jgi:ferredoxin
MRFRSLRSKEGMSRREFLRVIRLRNHGMPIIDEARCTGCGLCAMNCPTKALVISQTSGRDTYRLLFRQDACDACRVCQEVCPEHCLQWTEKEPEKNEPEEKVIFEDEWSRCAECGIPLFPGSMVRKLETQIDTNRGAPWPFSLCTSCRMKTQYGKEMTERPKL